MSDTENAIPLVIDLDGTLLRSDILLELLLVFLRCHPFRLWQLLIWLAKGKACLKSRLSVELDLDVSVLPYNTEVLEWLKRERNTGREIVLATATHQSYARRIADFLGCFDSVMASSDTLNLASQNKSALLVEKYGSKGFDYAGNSKADIKVWQKAAGAIVVNPNFGVLARVRKTANVIKVIENRPLFLKSLVKALRLHQWVKNLLIFVPAAASHQITDLALLGQVALGFLFFGLCASSVYLLNDLLDLEDDRHHPRKRDRPFACGALDLRFGVLLAPVTLTIALLGSLLFLPLKFLLVLLAYYLLTLAYSFKLKRLVLVDVVTLAALYTTRIVAGAMILGPDLTFWILAFSMFIFLSLALVKRYAELFDARKSGNEKAPGRGYYSSDLEMLSSLGAAAGYLAVLVLALYISDGATARLYAYPMVIWLACPILLYWISRIWMLTHRGMMHDDPIVFAVKDRVSQVVGLLFILVFWIAI